MSKKFQRMVMRKRLAYWMPGINLVKVHTPVEFSFS